MVLDRLHDLGLAESFIPTAVPSSVEGSQRSSSGRFKAPDPGERSREQRVNKLLKVDFDNFGGFKKFTKRPVLFTALL